MPLLVFGNAHFMLYVLISVLLASVIHKGYRRQLGFDPIPCFILS